MTLLCWQFNPVICHAPNKYDCHCLEIWNGCKFFLFIWKKVSFLGSLINVDAASYTGVEVEHLPVNYFYFKICFCTILMSLITNTHKIIGIFRFISEMCDTSCIVVRGAAPTGTIRSFWSVAGCGAQSAAQRRHRRHEKHFVVEFECHCEQRRWRQRYAVVGRVATFVWTTSWWWASGCVQF